MDMPGETQPGHYTHQADENDGRKMDIAGTLFIPGIQAGKKKHESDVVEEAEELIEEPTSPRP